MIYNLLSIYIAIKGKKIQGKSNLYINVCMFNIDNYHIPVWQSFPENPEVHIQCFVAGELFWSEIHFPPFPQDTFAHGSITANM